MSDQSLRDRLIAAVLAETPQTPEGLVIVGWETDRFEGDYGEPEPIAARQIAAALRTIADDWASRPLGTARQQVAPELRELAEEMENNRD